MLALKHGETRSSSLGDGAYANESNDALDRKRALSGHVYGQEGMLGTEEGFSARIVGRYGLFASVIFPNCELHCHVLGEVV